MVIGSFVIGDTIRNDSVVDRTAACLKHPVGSNVATGLTHCKENNLQLIYRVANPPKVGTVENVG